MIRAARVFASMRWPPGSSLCSTRQDFAASRRVKASKQSIGSTWKSFEPAARVRRVAQARSIAKP